MFFNEEDNVTTIEVEKDTTNIQSSEMPDQDADVEDLDMESVDLDFDELKKNGYAPNVEGYSSKEGIDLSYDVLNNQKQEQAKAKQEIQTANQIVTQEVIKYVKDSNAANDAIDDEFVRVYNQSLPN